MSLHLQSAVETQHVLDARTDTKACKQIPRSNAVALLASAPMPKCIAGECTPCQVFFWDLIQRLPSITSMNDVSDEESLVAVCGLDVLRANCCFLQSALLLAVAWVVDMGVALRASGTCCFRL